MEKVGARRKTTQEVENLDLAAETKRSRDTVVSISISRSNTINIHKYIIIMGGVSVETYLKSRVS